MEVADKEAAAASAIEWVKTTSTRSKKLLDRISRDLRECNALLALDQASRDLRECNALLALDQASRDLRECNALLALDQASRDLRECNALLAHRQKIIKLAERSSMSTREMTWQWTLTMRSGWRRRRTEQRENWQRKGRQERRG